MKKVLVAMSGGVDSSVAAAILKDGGYEVVGATMKLWHAEDFKQKMGGCCSLEDISDARRVCHHLGIRHYAVNFEHLFESSVVENFKKEYLAGRTPNPCIVCNDVLKFNELLKKSESLGFDFLATGHYARIENRKQRTENRGQRTGINCILKKGIDQKKDQSYFLYRLTQKQLSKILFPVGGMTKKEVRVYASKKKLPVADKRESHDICFIGGGDYRKFFAHEECCKRESSGEILNLNREVIGFHDGVHSYTIGQRAGLKINSKERLYVVSIVQEKNTLIVGPRESTYSKKFGISNVSWCGPPPELPEKFDTKIRYHHKGALAEVSAHKKTKRKLSVEFSEPQHAITPGQAAVFYKKDTVIGGGVIDVVGR